MISLRPDQPLYCLYTQQNPAPFESQIVGKPEEIYLFDHARYFLVCIHRYAIRHGTDKTVLSIVDKKTDHNMSNTVAGPSRRTESLWILPPQSWPFRTQCFYTYSNRTLNLKHAITGQLSPHAAIYHDLSSCTSTTPELTFVTTIFARICKYRYLTCM